MKLLENEQIESLMLGDYKIIQSASLYRFTSDAIHLSRFAKCKKGETVADICSGSGIVGLHFFALNEKLVKSVSLFEMQKPLADMSKRSIELNGLGSVFNVENCKIQEIPKCYENSFSLVLCNPPYKKGGSGIISEEQHIAVCKHEITVDIYDICACAKKLLKNGGRICLCNKCERLSDVLLALAKYNLSPSRLVFIHGASQSAPYLFFIEAYKGVEKQLKVDKPIINNTKSISAEF